MRAITYHRYGPPDVVALTEVPKPVPRDKEVLIRIHATTVSTGDWRARSLNMPAGFDLFARPVFGLFGPRKPVLGMELAGVIEATGKTVSRFKPGDEVFAFPGALYGCHAEYRTMPEDGLIARKPANLSFEQASALSFGGTTALHFLRRAGIKRGDSVLIVGASGSVGTAAVQLAKHFGARVTGVCSTANVDLVGTIGADSVIDYTATDFAATGERYDIILDTTDTAPLARCEPLLKQGGRLIEVLASLSFRRARPDGTSGKRVIAGVAAVRPEDLQKLAELARLGVLLPIIDRSYPSNAPPKPTPMWTWGASAEMSC